MPYTVWGWWLKTTHINGWASWDGFTVGLLLVYHMKKNIAGLLHLVIASYHRLWSLDAHPRSSKYPVFT
jgi:hypothetical protein